MVFIVKYTKNKYAQYSALIFFGDRASEYAEQEIKSKYLQKNVECCIMYVENSAICDFSLMLEMK